MYSKVKLYNLALNLLLLQRQIIDPTTDKSNEVKVLNQNWDMALRMALEDMDLDSTSQPYTLQMLAMNYGPQANHYVYAYPPEASFVRRLDSGFRTDNRYTKIDMRVGIYGTQKAIFTLQGQAIAEVIRHDMDLSALSAPAGVPIACRLAILSAPLIVGKGARRLMVQLENEYKTYKAFAQSQDARENFNYEPDQITSEFVAERMS